MGAPKRLDVPLLFKLWNDHSIEHRELAARLGISMSHLWKVKKQYGLPSRKRQHVFEEIDPTPEEIEERSAEVRMSWTPEIEALRNTVKTRRWTPPMSVSRY
jgi:hypothetical protein